MEKGGVRRASNGETNAARSIGEPTKVPSKYANESATVHVANAAAKYAGINSNYKLSQKYERLSRSYKQVDSLVRFFWDRYFQFELDTEPLITCLN